MSRDDADGQTMGFRNSDEVRNFQDKSMTTTPQTPIDALMAQARACAENLRLVSQTRRVQEACDLLKQCARALAAMPAAQEGAHMDGETCLWARNGHAPCPRSAPAQDAQGVRPLGFISTFTLDSLRSGARLGAARISPNKDDEESLHVPIFAALRASSPADTREPLTEAQIEHLVDAHVGGPSPSYPLGPEDWINFARAVEHKHGIATKEST